MAAPIRIGTLGAARITPTALIRPARQIDAVEVVAVAARSEQRARKFAARHDIPRVHQSYQALIDDPTLEVIYNPLPNSLHHLWTIKALRAGKHVLCEKPIAANAGEAREMARVARSTGCILMEAFHNLYHPLVQQIRTVVEGGELGEIRHAEAHFNMPIPKFKDIRLEYDLAGGAMMDTGCYTVSLLRHLTGYEPEIISATATLASPQIDQVMSAQLRFPNGATGAISCALFLPWRARVSVFIKGTKGYVHALNPILPQYGNWLRVRTPKRRISKWIRDKSTYYYQLNALVQAIQNQRPFLTGGDFGMQNMEVIDDIYRKAGLHVRGACIVGSDRR